jgi:outer membrane protein OmpA-like peptidoglycan-associated protein
MYSLKSWLKIFVFVPLVIHPYFTNAQRGLVAEYFNDTEFKNPVLTRVESTPFLNYYKESPAPGVNKEYFSARWTGRITAPASGDFTFSLRADDGVRLWIDEKILIDAWREQEATTYEGSIALEKNKQYKIKIEYYNSWLHSVLMLSWETPEDGFTFLGYSFFRSLKEVPASAYSVDTSKPVSQKEATAIPIQKVIARQDTKSQSVVLPTTIKDKSPRKPEERRIASDSIKKMTSGSMIAINEIVELKSVRFVLSKYELLEGSYEELDTIAAYLKKYPHLRIKIIGHTDYEGNWTANYTLSKQRANAVADYLKANGIADQRIFVEAMGSSKPIVRDDKPENREQNRRVEFILIADPD